MTDITPHTKIEDGDYNADVLKQVRSTVTVDTDTCDAWVELFHASEGDELSDAARELYDDHFDGRDLDDISVGDYLEGILDYRTVHQASGELIEVQLLVGFGGPNVWHDVNAEGDITVRVYWWGTNGRGSGRHELYAMIFEYMSDLVACR